MPLLETGIDVENEGLASVTEAKENLGVLANSPGVSWPTSVLCGFPAKLLVLSLLSRHPPAFPGVYSVSQGLHPSGLSPMLLSLRTYCQPYLPRTILGAAWGSSPLLSGL